MTELVEKVLTKPSLNKSPHSKPLKITPTDDGKVENAKKEKKTVEDFFYRLLNTIFTNPDIYFPNFLSFQLTPFE